MRKTQIIALCSIAISIAVLLMFTGKLTTYETIASAKEKEGRAVKLVVSLVPNTVQYDAAKNPNYLEFMAKDSLNQTVKVIYHDAKPTDMEKSERIVLDGKMKGEAFECKTILLKCPSKYKNEESASKKVVS